MRLTNRLCAQHLGWTFKKHWQVQGQRVARDTGAAADLEKFGIHVKDVEEFLTTKKEPQRVEIFGLKQQVIPEDETHPNWHKKPCHIYGDTNVVLEGVPQAQLLTNTIAVNGLPKSVEERIRRMQLSRSVDRSVQNSILASLAFDGEQVKLPKVKVPERPRYNLPRQFGISHDRKNRLLINKLIFECEKVTEPAVLARRRLIDQVDFRVTIPKDDDLLQFAVAAEKMITSSRPLEPLKEKAEGELPDLYPIKATISIPKKNIYTTDTFYPFSSGLNCSHPHTVFLVFDKEKTGNLHGSSVTTTQFQSRALLKAFAIAATRAKQLYGDAAVESLPKPIVVQSIQTDGKTFHFGVFQLNTLALGANNTTKNIWFHETNMNLFEECGYVAGKPILEGFNSDVFRCINAFYNSS